MNLFFSSRSLWQSNILAITRIITGLLMAYHGLEVFDHSQIVEYSKWDSVSNLPAPLLMAYIGKGLELLTGVCFVVGFLTRLAALLMAIDMIFICFRIGNGKFWYEDQHPFLFALLAILYFFTGPGKWSIDNVMFKKQ